MRASTVFGHLGDGNLHYNLFPAPGRDRAYYDGERKALSAMVHEMVMARGRSPRPSMASDG